jgi:SDR family mycofactocin-dependent oxidoreductase
MAGRRDDGCSVTAPQRVSVATSAAQGIAAATVRQPAAAGRVVVAVDSASDDPMLPYAMATREDLQAVSESAPRAVHEFTADVCDPSALAEAVSYAERTFGVLDAAIACAGVIAGGTPQWQVPIEQDQAVIDIDLGGVLNLERVAVPALLRRPAPRAGRFLAIATTAARCLPMLAAYCAAKAGVAGLVRAWAVELGQSGVTGNAVSPGSTATAMLDETARLYGLAGATAFADEQPVGPLLDPGEVAAVLVFLARPASSGMTGAVIPDGGLSL